MATVVGSSTVLEDGVSIPSRTARAASVAALTSAVTHQLRQPARERRSRNENQGEDDHDRGGYAELEAAHHDAEYRHRLQEVAQEPHALAPGHVDVVHDGTGSAAGDGRRAPQSRPVSSS